MMCRFILLLVIGLISQASAQDFGRRERTFDVQHYRIELSFDEPGKTLHGVVTTTIKPLHSAFAEFSLDAVNMSIEGVTIAGKTLSFTYDSTKLTIQLDREYSVNEVIQYSVRYRCTPSKGMYFIAPNASYPDDPEQIWTQGQAEDNRHWLPCYDYPNDKATSEVLMKVRDGFETLSNGYLKSKNSNGDGTSTWHWVQDKPHSSYLIMLAVGKYSIHKTEYDGIPIHSYHYASDHPDDVIRTYQTMAEMTKFMSEKIGIRYPWSKYAQINVRHFMYGGMENTTATVMNDKRMVVDARAALDYSPEGLIAHELAHQWWGDYTTYADWENGWLNEGFATYFQQVWTQFKFGEDDFTTQRNDGIKGYTDWADRVGRFPVVSKTGNSGANIYSKGASILHMLRTLLGEEQFWRVIKTFGETFALQNVESNDLKRTIEQVTGKNLQWFFDQWLYRAGYPELLVAKQWDVGSKTLSMRIQQTQKMDSVCGVFRLPLDIRFQTSAGKFVDHRIWLMNSDSSYTFLLDSKPLFISVDHGSTLSGKVKVEQSQDELLAHLQYNPDVRKRVLAAEELLKFGEDGKVRSALLKSGKSDAHYSVRTRIASGFADMKSDSISFKKEHRTFLLEMTKDQKANIRATAVNGLNKLRDPSLRKRLEELLKDSSYFVEAAAMNAVMMFDSLTSTPLVQQRLRAKSYRDVLALDGLSWVGKYRLNAAMDDVIALTKPGQTVAVRTKAWATLLLLGINPQTARPLLDKQLAESVVDFRIMSIDLIAKLFPKEAAQALAKHRLTEKDNRVKLAIDKLLSGN